MFFFKRKKTNSRGLELQIYCYKFYSKIVNFFILKEFFFKLFQNLFINIDDTNGQSNCIDVI